MILINLMNEIDRMISSPTLIFLSFVLCIGLVFLVVTIHYHKNNGEKRKVIVLTSVLCLVFAAIFGLSLSNLIDPNGMNYYKIVGSSVSPWTGSFSDRYQRDVLNSIDFDNLDVSRMEEPSTIITTKDKSLAYALIDGKGHIVISDDDKWLFSISQDSEQIELNNVYLLLQKEGYKEIRVIAHNAITIYDPVNTGQIINYEDIKI